jgi:acetyl-CoA acetyltransferase
MAIEAGQCDVALVCYADNPRTGNRAVFARPRGDDAAYGWFSTAAGYAMIQRRHVIEYGTPPRGLRRGGLASRRHGAGNPHAQLRKPLTMDAVPGESPWVVDPLRRDDCALVSDGGAAVVVMSARRAPSWASPAGAGAGIRPGPDLLGVPLRPDAHHHRSRGRRRHRFCDGRRSRPQDVDVAQIYDCFTITVLMTLEDYGFCAKGEGGRFVPTGASSTAASCRSTPAAACCPRPACPACSW